MKSRRPAAQLARTPPRAALPFPAGFLGGKLNWREASLEAPVELDKAVRLRGNAVQGAKAVVLVRGRYEQLQWLRRHR